MKKIDNLFSIISSDCFFNGSIDSKSTIEVVGKFEGDLNCESLYCREGGFIFGNINSEFVQIGGNFDGKIVCNKLFINSSAKLNGEFIYSTIQIESGAIVDGVFKFKDQEKPKQ